MKNKPYQLYAVNKFNNLKELTSFCANLYKDRIAFQFYEHNDLVQIDYQQFLMDINGLGTALFNMGLHQVNVALISENSYLWIVSYFSVVNGGNCIVPLDPELTEDSLEALLADTKIRLIICSQKYLSKIEKIKVNTDLLQVLVIEKDLAPLILKGKKLIDFGDHSFTDAVINNDSCCAIIYTSGTTGRPKGVMLSHKNLTSNTTAALKNVFFAGSSILILPLYHTFAFTASVLCLLQSGKTISINRHLRYLKKDLSRYKPQNLIVVPLILETLYKQIWIKAKEGKKDKLLKILIIISRMLLRLKIDIRKKAFKSVLNEFGGNLEFIITGGAPVNNIYVQGFQDIGIQVLNGYGITECSPVVAVNRNQYFRCGSVGQVLDGVELKIDKGEICVKSEMVMLGYYKEENSLIDGWFLTGDLGYLDQDGFLYITGRKKNVIILNNGKNISPEELEEQFYNLDYVKEVVVFQRGEQIAAEVYLGDGGADLYALRLKNDLEIMNKQLPIYKNINHIFIRDKEFEKTSTKKIRRESVYAKSSV